MCRFFSFFFGVHLTYDGPRRRDGNGEWIRLGCSVHVRENSTVGYVLNVRRNNGRRCECELTTARELCTRRAIDRRASEPHQPCIPYAQPSTCEVPRNPVPVSRQTTSQPVTDSRAPPERKKKRSSDIARESDCDAYKRPILRSDTTHTHSFS